jgi:hypothetical protein
MFSMLGLGDMAIPATSDPIRTRQIISPKDPITHHRRSCLQLPLKLLFPNWTPRGLMFSMLGLGDMAIPGLFVSFALSYDDFLASLTRNKKREDDDPDVEMQPFLLAERDPPASHSGAARWEGGGGGDDDVDDGVDKTGEVQEEGETDDVEKEIDDGMMMMMMVIPLCHSPTCRGMSAPPSLPSSSRRSITATSPSASSATPPASSPPWCVIIA